MVSGSAWTSGSASRRKEPSSSSMPGFASSRTIKPLVTISSLLSPWCVLSLQLAVDVDIDLLGVEADQSGDLLALRERGRVGPRDVRANVVPRSQRPVLRRALVRAMTHALAPDQKIHADVGHRHVVAR